MGNIRQKNIKNISFKILEKFGEKFGEKFEENKKIVFETTDITSKRLSNRIAGYITKIVKVNNKKKENKINVE